MKRIALSIAAFFGVQLVGAYILWMGGFNFDERNPLIGYFALVVAMIGVIAGFAVYKETEDKK